MVKFSYVKAKEEELFLESRDSETLSKTPKMFSSREEAYQAYIHNRSVLKMAGKPTILMEIKEVDL